MELLQILVRYLAGSIDNCFLQTASPANEFFCQIAFSKSKSESLLKTNKVLVYLLQVSSLFVAEKFPLYL